MESLFRSKCTGHSVAQVVICFVLRLFLDSEFLGLLESCFTQIQTLHAAEPNPEDTHEKRSSLLALSVYSLGMPDRLWNPGTIWHAPRCLDSTCCV